MSTLDRYILNTFTRNLALVLLTLVSLYGLIEFLDTVDDFIEFHADLKYYLIYPLHLLPLIVTNSLPMAALLATFATIGGFSRSGQLTAMLSGGISYSGISRPLFLSGLVLAFAILLANLWLVPWSERESNYILRTRIQEKTPQTANSKNLFFRDGNRIVSINHSFPAKSSLIGLTIIEFNEKFKPVRRIQAKEATYTNQGQWRLSNVVVWDFIPDTSDVISFTQQTERLIDLKRKPDEMLQLWDRPEDLTVGELLNLTTKLQDEGYDAKAYLMETHLRFAKAAVPIIMVLIGIPFALQRGRSASFSLGIVISLVIFAVYFVLYAVFAVFGAISVLPPLVAAWAANALMVLIGCWLFLNAQT